ncbi:hypothetical protein [Isoptericola cucumis]|uniref:hypothetical protein n=1 Tax=Isoptericola cucumis TaxID=1776856 RepID=UPI0016691786|nr:hypothetical protein [Isoptericola cucumis]
MVEKLGDVWFSRDLPVLIEVARRVEAGSNRIPPEEVGEALRLPLGEVMRAGVVLRDRGLVTVQGASGRPILWFSNITGAAYPLTGLHPEPDAALDRLVAALEAAEKTAPEAERGKIRQVLEGVAGMARDVAVEVMGAAISGRLP